jgi:hypothetical protein
MLAMALLVLSHHQGDVNFWNSHLGALMKGKPLAEVAGYLYWFWASVALYLVAPVMALALTPDIRVRETGIGLGDWRAGLLISGAVLAAFLPIVYVASLSPAFAGHYPLAGAAKANLRTFAIYEISYAAYFIGWEYLFRGYLLFSLEKGMGKLAVFAQMMPFVVAHFGKPEAETFGSIFAGVGLGLLALRTRSFWYGALIHIAVAVSMDCFAGLKLVGKP